MTTSRALDGLRRKKQCLERAIRALEELQELEAGVDPGQELESAPGIGTSNVVVLPRRV